MRRLFPHSSRARGSVLRDWRGPLLALVLLGLGLRVAAFLMERPLDGDELSLYLNLRAFDGARLVAGRLDATAMSQAAPPLFLLIEDAAANRLPPPMTGVGERLLRLLPLICGLLTIPAALWLTALVARPLRDEPRREAGPWLPPLRPTALLLAAAAVALSSRLIDVSHRTKQYAGDCLVTLLLIALLLWLRRRGTRPLVLHLVLGLAAAAAFWFSHPAVLVYAALAPADVLLDAGRRRWLRKTAGRLLASLPGGAVALASGLTLYLVSVVRQRDDSLQHWWGDAFLQERRWWDWPLEILKTTQDLPRYGLPPAGALWSLLAVAGLVALWGARDRVAAAALVGPTLTTIVASCASLYPFTGQRVCLFLAPPLLVLAAVGGAWLWRSRVTPIRVAATALAILPLAFAAFDAARATVNPDPTPRRAAADLAQRFVAGDTVISYERQVADTLAVYEPQLPAGPFWYAAMPRPIQAKRLPPPEKWQVGRTWLLVGPKPGGDRLLTREAMGRVPPGWSAESVGRMRGGELLLLRPPPQ